MAQVAEFFANTGESVERDFTSEELAQRESDAVLQVEEALNKVEQDRRVAYEVTADPLFFKWQRGDGTEAEWLAAVEAVKIANPYPEA
jgi:hypothetical protein